jgi:hypothetical protein
MNKYNFGRVLLHFGPKFCPPIPHISKGPIHSYRKVCGCKGSHWSKRRGVRWGWQKGRAFLIVYQINRVCTSLHYSCLDVQLKTSRTDHSRISALAQYVLKSTIYRNIILYYTGSYLTSTCRRSLDTHRKRRQWNIYRTFENKLLLRFIWAQTIWRNRRVEKHRAWEFPNA